MSKQNMSSLIRPLASADVVDPSGLYGLYPYQPGMSQESGGGGINLGYGVSVGQPEGLGGGGGSTAMPGDGGGSGGGADPYGGGVDQPADYAPQIKAWYQTYLGREASDDEVRVHMGNPGGLTAIESTIRDSPEGKAYAKTKTTTSGSTTKGSPTDPAWVEEQIKQAWRKYHGEEIPAERLAYWKGKALTPDIYSDGYWRVGWNPYWEDRLRTGSDSSNPALAGDDTKIASKKRWEGYEQDDPANAPASPASPVSPTTTTNTPVAPVTPYKPRDYGAAPTFAPVTFGNALTQYGTNMVTMTPEAYRKLVEAQQPAAQAPTAPMSALATLPWQKKG